MWLALRKSGCVKAQRVRHATWGQLPVLLVALASGLSAGAAPAGAAPADLDTSFNPCPPPRPTFPCDGIVAGAFAEQAYDVVVQQLGGKTFIVAAGGSEANDSGPFVVARYDDQGKPDKSFNACPPGVTDLCDGVVGTTKFGAGPAKRAAIQRDGKIVAVGAVGGDFLLVRYNPDGSLDDGPVGDGGLPDSDPSDRFGTDGSVKTDIAGAGDSGSDLAIQRDGKIVTVGTASISGRDFVVLTRHNPDGTLDDGGASDSSPGDSFRVPGVPPGLVTSAEGQGEAVAIQADGRVVAAGSTKIEGGDFLLVRYNRNGSLDDGFSGDSTPGDRWGIVTPGLVETDFAGQDDFARAVAIQADGKVVAAGRADVPGVAEEDFALARYEQDGSPDKSFNPCQLGQTTPCDGKRTHGVTASFPKGLSDVKIDLDGRIVAVGTAGDTFFLVRYKPGGGRDESFGNCGAVATPIAPPDPPVGLLDFARAVAIQPDGRIVTAGKGALFEIPAAFALVRYRGDGVGPYEPVVVAQQSCPLLVTRRRLARVPVGCPASRRRACRGTLTLRSRRARRLRIGARAYRVPVGRTRMVRVRISRHAMRVLRRRGSLRIRAIPRERTGRLLRARTYRLELAR
jgi:uncharacterized delta-60 repeat protein